MRRRGCLIVVAVLLVLLAGGSVLLLSSFDGSIPRDAEGLVVFVSDRSGTDSLWARRLPDGDARQITFNLEPVKEPALSPDATQVAFGEGGRISILTIANGMTRHLTLGIDYEDASPSWRPDGLALVVSATRKSTGRTSLDILDLQAVDPAKVRSPLTSGSVSDTFPVFAPDGTYVVFVREEALHRVSLENGRTTRITGGFQTWSAPRFLPTGRLVAQWAQNKQFGVAEMDGEGKSSATLWKGTTRYRGIAPSADGRFLAASYGYDLQFQLAETLGLRRDGEIRLLSRDGQLLGRLAGGLRERAHSPDWGPQEAPNRTTNPAR